MTTPTCTHTHRSRLGRRVLARASCAVLVGASQAHAELIDIDWNASQRFERKLNIAPGKFAEVCGALQQGHGVSWRFDADGALNFNIHYHVGKDVHYPARADAVRSQQGELAVPAPQDYCWMWTNKTAGVVALQLELARK